VYLSNAILENFADCKTAKQEHTLTKKILKDIKSITHKLKTRKAPAIIVTNELGSGIVPENRLARVYRDLVGSANQAVAKKSQEVYHVVSGIPQRIK